MDTGNNGSGTLVTKDEKAGIKNSEVFKNEDERIRINYSNAYSTEDRKAEIQRIQNVSMYDVINGVWGNNYYVLTKTQADARKKSAAEQFDYLAYKCQKLIMSIEMLAEKSSEDEKIIKELEDKINLFTDCKDVEKRRKLFWEKYAIYTSDGMFDGLISSEELSEEYLNGGNFICPPGKTVSAKAFESLTYFDSITFDEKDIAEGVECKLPHNVKKIYIVYSKKHTANVSISSTDKPAVLTRQGKEIWISSDKGIVKISKKDVCNT